MLDPSEHPVGSRFAGAFKPEVLVLLVPAAVKLLLHLLAINGYGLHGDELYYLACSDHLDWGYVDHPALSILGLHLERALFGDAVWSIRVLAALSGTACVVLTGLLARRMGAGLFGQLLAGVCALVAPVYLAVNHYYSMNGFDNLFWLTAIYVLVRIVNEQKPTLWIWFGLIMGIGFENKISVLFLGFGIFVGLLLTKERRWFLSPWIWLGAFVAMLFMMPYVLWNRAHDWPTLEWMANARSQKMVVLPFLAFMREQIILMQPLTVIIWGTGLIALFVHPSLSRYRLLGWSYVTVLGVFIFQGGKPYYLSPIYPVLFAAGAIVLEHWLARPWPRISSVSLVLVCGAVTAPMGMPLLPVETFVCYQDAIGLRPSMAEKYAEGRLPSFFANFFGWNDLAATVDSVYRSLPVDDQAKCGIYGQNYMQAGAIDFYGRHLGLPHAIAGHNNYWLWGTRGYTSEVMIVIGGSVRSLQDSFEEVTERARFRNAYIQPIHSNVPIYVVRGLKRPLAQLWPLVKSYI